MAKHSVCFIGDETLLGLRDPEGFGWPQRLTRAERDAGHAVIAYGLGVEADTTADVARRWRAEAEARLSTLPASALVFCFGLNDQAADGDGVRVPLPETLYLAEAVIAEAASWRACFWIGPPPVVSGGVSVPGRQGRPLFYDPVRLRGLSQGFAAIAARCGVPFLDLCGALSADARYAGALRSGNGVIPAGDGQAVIAAAAGAWAPWRDWLDNGRATNLHFVSAAAGG
ncbi:GDSL-type esterase/lipase family protein [Oleispirillum naphthae]|uniref:GDSL-type esterase/lipase family protein n=1 Tax=Oleispirillum naphthae TaxID=2838853 RepID=UPI003082696E